MPPGCHAPATEYVPWVPSQNLVFWQICYVPPMHKNIEYHADILLLSIHSTNALLFHQDTQSHGPCSILQLVIFHGRFSWQESDHTKKPKSCCQSIPVLHQDVCHHPRSDIPNQWQSQLFSLFQSRNISHPNWPYPSIEIQIEDQKH